MLFPVSLRAGPGGELSSYFIQLQCGLTASTTNLAKLVYKLTRARMKEMVLAPVAPVAPRGWNEEGE
jgi:hypothetical protein